MSATLHQLEPPVYRFDGDTYPSLAQAKVAAVFAIQDLLSEDIKDCVPFSWWHNLSPAKRAARTARAVLLDTYEKTRMRVRVTYTLAAGPTGAPGTRRELDDLALIYADLKSARDYVRKQLGYNNY